MPNQVDLSAVDPIVDDRLDALEAGGGGGGPSGIGHIADYANYSASIALAVAGPSSHACLAADYEEGDGFFDPAEDNLVPAMDTDGTITFETATAVIVRLYASAQFESAPADDGDVVFVVEAGGVQPPLKETPGTGDGSATGVTVDRTSIFAVKAGDTLGPMTVGNLSATLDCDVTELEFTITLMS